MKPSRRAALAAVALSALLGCGQKTQAQSPPPPMPAIDDSQSASDSTSTSTAAAPTATATGEAAPPQAGTATPSGVAPTEALTDEQIATVTSLANNTEIEQAKLARARSKDEQVLQFAGMMIAHHGDAQQKQNSMSLGSAESTLSRDMVVEGNETLKTLKEKTGAEFDRAYMQAQVQAHQKVLDAIEGKLLPSAKREDLKAYLSELRPRVKQHLEQAERTAAALASRQGPSVATQ